MDRSKSYSYDMQKLFLEMFLAHSESFIRCQNIFSHVYFDKNLRETAKFIGDYIDQYKTLPDVRQIKAATHIELIPADGLQDEHYNWLVDEFELFCRHKALEKAILESADLLEKGEYGIVEEKIKAATQIALTRDLGINYFDDPRKRLLSIKDSNGQVSTGWQNLDHKLYGGFNRGELNIFAGGSGAGKSLFLQNLSLTWALAGLNVIYFTLELSKELTSMRIDSMLTGVSTREIFKNIDDIEIKVTMAGKKSGILQVKEMPAQSTTNDLRAYLKEFQIQRGVKPDAILVDYLDLMLPNNKRVSPSDLFIKDKYVSEELRNLAKEYKYLLVTASQLNRASIEEVEFDHSHIAGGLSKIQTADNVFGIFTSRGMRERGRYQIQFLKTRSSSGVGSKVDLDFNIETLRITDALQTEQSTSLEGRNIYDELKTKSKVIPANGSDDHLTSFVPKATQVQGNKLRDYLNNMRRTPGQKQ